MTDNLQFIFPGFEKGLLDDITKYAQVKNFHSGEVLMKTGQYFRSILLIVDGLIKVYREDDDGNEYFMYYLQPGNACALSMICATKSEQSQVMAKAAKETTVIAVPVEHMDKWMQEYKTWYQFVLETYRRRFEELLQTLDSVAFRNMDERLLAYLKREQEMHKSNLLTINNTEVAHELNSSREVISRLMKKLSEKGMIKLLKGQQVEIVNLNL